MENSESMLNMKCSLALFHNTENGMFEVGNK